MPFAHRHGHLHFQTSTTTTSVSPNPGSLEPLSSAYSSLSSPLSPSSSISMSSLSSFQLSSSSSLKIPQIAANFARQISDTIYQPSLSMFQNFSEYSRDNELQYMSSDPNTKINQFPINSTHSVIIWPNGSTITYQHLMVGQHLQPLPGTGPGGMNISEAAIEAEFSILSNRRHVLMILFYSIIILVSLTGNFLVCKVTLGNRDMRTTTNLLIASLAFSDILMTVFNIPFNVIRMLPMSWPFGPLVCILVPMIQYSCVYVSTFTMMLIALHRLWTVSQKRYVVGRPSEKRVALTVLGIWFVALALACPHAAFNRVREKKFMGRILHRCKVEFPNLGFNAPLWLSVEVLITQYLVPLSITAIVYIKIGRIIARQGKLICKLSDQKKRKQSEAKRKRIVMLVLALVTFATCWAPINLYLFLVDFKLLELKTDIFIVCHWFAMSSVCYNPMILCWFNEKFRDGAKQTIQPVFGCFCRRFRLNKSVEVNRNSGNTPNGSPNNDDNSTESVRILLATPTHPAVPMITIVPNTPRFNSTVKVSETIHTKASENNAPSEATVPVSTTGTSVSESVPKCTTGTGIEKVSTTIASPLASNATVPNSGVVGGGINPTNGHTHTHNHHHAHHHHHMNHLHFHTHLANGCDTENVANI